MGRVTFRDQKVIEKVSQKFSATWLNTGTSYKGNALSCGKEDLTSAFAAWWPSGRASSNVKTLISNPEGELLHVIPGYVKPGDLVRELDFALEVGEALDKAGTDKAARRGAFVALHEKRLKDLERRYGKAARTRVAETKDMSELS